jgi:AraC-like DNA-binding protein
MNEEIIKRLRQLTTEEIELLNGRKAINKEIYMNSLSTVVDSHKLLDKGGLIRVRTHTRFVHYPKHTHNYVEVVYMCDGHTNHIINGDSVTLNKGELLFLNQNVTQEIMEAGENDIAVNFIILPEFFDQSLKMIGEEENLVRDFIIGCLTNDDSKIGCLHFKVSDILPIQNLVENLIWTIMNDQQNNRSINQITMGLLFLQLMNYTDKVTTGGDHFEQQLMFIVLRFIEEHYKDGELSDLAESLHYDLYWISRTIKKLTGRTYTELVQAKRLSQAAYLLNNTKIPVSDIGYAVGYNNLSYFYRIFKGRHGASPKQYRVARGDIR